MNEQAKIAIAERLLAKGFQLIPLIGKSPISKATISDAAHLRLHVQSRPHANVGLILPADITFVDMSPPLPKTASRRLFTVTPSGGRHDFVLRSQCTDKHALSHRVAMLPESTVAGSARRYLGSSLWDAPDPFVYVRAAVAESSPVRQHAPNLTGETPDPFWVVLAEDHEAIFPDQAYNFARIPTEAQAYDLAAELAAKHRRVFHVLRRCASVSLRVT